VCRKSHCTDSSLRGGTGDSLPCSPGAGFCNIFLLGSLVESTEEVSALNMILSLELRWVNVHRMGWVGWDL